MHDVADVVASFGDRFELRRELGAGGMGVVFEAFDRARGHAVALKTIRTARPDAVPRFKREFRAVSDFVHPNVLRVYELLATSDERWLLTMELVEGCHFLDHVARGSISNHSDAATFDTAQPTPRGTTVAVDDVCDLSRLRRALVQLASAVAEIHRAGRLHHDLKPSNVLVDRRDRVVVADFGLISELGDDESVASMRFGTPAYVSPERIQGGEVGPASDWYSVGVMLYRALTGELPFGCEGDALAKTTLEVVPPSRLVRGVPAHLDALCVELLSRDPRKRASAEKIRERLDQDAPHAVASIRNQVTCDFVGRERERAALRAAYAELFEHRRAMVVYLHGPSGIGKSTLLQHVEHELARDSCEMPLVLRSRCYERETTPFKALDGIVDGLARWLATLPAFVRADLVPADASCLVRLFPALMPFTPDPPPALALAPDRIKSEALSALRELVDRVARWRPLVLCIDDAQWGDADSADALSRVFARPAPPVLLVAAYRTADAEASPLLADLRMLTHSPFLDLREIAIEPLERGPATELAHRLLGDRGDEADAIVGEAGGNPLYLAELARHVQSSVSLAVGGRLPRLDDFIRMRFDALPSAARDLLAALAIANEPTSIAVLSRVIGIANCLDPLLLLVAQNLARQSAGFADRAETYHDRVRETVVAALPSPVRRRLHLAFAAAYSALGGDDRLHAVVTHRVAAGETSGVVELATRAAARATALFAFDNAARLYAVAIAHLPADAEARGRLLALRADTFALAGRGGAAADAYLEASEHHAAPRALELRRLAAEHMLRSGDYERGQRLLREVLTGIGMRLAKTPLRALVALACRRAWIYLRGGSLERTTPPADADALHARVDASWSIASALALIDSIYSAEFQTRHFLMAMRTCDPYRVARGFALEAIHVGAAGSAARRRSTVLLAHTDARASASGSAHARGLAAIAHGMVAFLCGDWQIARHRCGEAHVALRVRRESTAWEAANARLFELASQFYLGNWAEMSRGVFALLEEGEARSDEFLLTNLRCWRTNVAWLMIDDAAAASRQVDRGIGRWSTRGFHLQHYYAMLSRAQIALYEGDGARSEAELATVWPRLKRSLLLNTVQNLRIEAYWLRGRSALAAGATPAMLACARRCVRRLEREHVAWADGLATLLLAGMHARHDRRELARDYLRSAAARFDTCGMRLHAAAARAQWGALGEGPHALGVQHGALRLFSEEGVRRPERMVRMLAPGFAKEDA